jgi:hypothetical protein
MYWAPENPYIHVDMWSIYQDSLCGVDCHAGNICFKGTVTGPMYLNTPRHPFYLPFISTMGISQFTFNKMAHHHTTIGTSEHTMMKPYHVNGYDKEVVLSIPHAHLI